MPHASEDGGAAGEDACSSDELIVFKDEDGGEDVVKRSSDKVTEEKSDLIDLSESEVSIYYVIYIYRGVNVIYLSAINIETVRWIIIFPKLLRLYRR